MPDLSILHPANVATPLLAVAGFAVQASVAPLVPVPLVIASVTLLASPVTVFPFWSWTVTFGWVENAIPPVELLGDCVNASLLALPGVTLNELAFAGAVRDGVLVAVSL